MNSFEKVLKQLKSAVDLNRERDLTSIEEQGLIQAFEFTHELAWNLMKDYFEYQGSKPNITGSRDAIREAFNKGLIADGDGWMEMIRSRDQSTHTYNEGTADDIRRKVVRQYMELFIAFQLKMNDG